MNKIKKIITIVVIIKVLIIGGLKPISEKQTPQASAATLDITEKVDFYKRATGKEFGTILKLYNPAIDEQNRRLYFVGSKTTSVGVIDLDKDELIDTFDIDALGGFLFFYGEQLYSYDVTGGNCYEIDTLNKNAKKTVLSTCVERVPADQGAVKTVGNYSFQETGYESFDNGTTGFSPDWRQDLNGAYGVIVISDLVGNKVGEIVHGPDANFFAIDESTKKLYTTNTGYGSVSVFDLNNLENNNYCEKNSCLVKEIEVGDSADQVIADSAGNLYVRNRLGGSTIFKYNQLTKSLDIIENENIVSDNAAIWNGNWQGEMGLGMWPTDMALSGDEERLYVLSHYGALIDVVNTNSNKVEAKIKFNTKLKPRTDSISPMALDKSRDRIYVAFPELGLIGMADGKSNKVLGTIDLTKYGFDKVNAANRGPGIINIAIDDESNTLFVFLFYNQKLLAFDGDTLAKKNEVDVTIEEKKEKLLMVNSSNKEVYLGKTIFDSDTLAEKDSFSQGEKVEAVDDTTTNLVYLEEFDKFKETLKIYEFASGSLKREWQVDNLGEIVTTFFDFKNEVFYVADFTSASVIKKNLSDSSTPTCTLNFTPTEIDFRGKSALSWTITGEISNAWLSCDLAGSTEVGEILRTYPSGTVDWTVDSLETEICKLYLNSTSSTGTPSCSTDPGLSVTNTCLNTCAGNSCWNGTEYVTGTKTQDCSGGSASFDPISITPKVEGTPETPAEEISYLTWTAKNAKALEVQCTGPNPIDRGSIQLTSALWQSEAVAEGFYAKPGSTTPDGYPSWFHLGTSGTEVCTFYPTNSSDGLPGTPFSATVQVLSNSTCGNNIQETGEECDGSNSSCSDNKTCENCKCVTSTNARSYVCQSDNPGCDERICQDLYCFDGCDYLKGKLDCVGRR